MSMQNVSKQVPCHSAATSSGVNLTSKLSCAFCILSEYPLLTSSSCFLLHVPIQATTSCRRSSALVKLATHISKRTKINGRDRRDGGISSQPTPRRALLISWTSGSAAGDPPTCLSLQCTLDPRLGSQSSDLFFSCGWLPVFFSWFV